MVWRGFSHPWDPWQEVDEREEEMHHLFVGAYAGTGHDHPPANVWINEERAVVIAEVPGIAAQDLELSVINDTLTLKGSRPPEELQEGDRYHRRERGFGDFTRSIRLPCQVVQKEAKAEVNRGVIRVDIPRALAGEIPPTRIDVAGHEKAERKRKPKVFTPRADIFERGDAIVVIADIPGVGERSLEITLDENILTIDGRVEPEPLAGFIQSWREYDVGDYHRTFTLSDTVAREGIEAKIKNGVLRLTLPKFGPSHAHRIPVQGE